MFGDGETVSGTATIAWSPEFGATFISTGLTTNAEFLNIDAPGFTASQFNSFGFSTRTGGANMQLLIDNIQIDSVDPDSDNDSLADVWEDHYGLSSSDDGTADVDNGPTGNPDGDGLDNLAEQAAGTDPTKADTDGDMLNDDVELAGAGDRPPTDPSRADTDGDGLDDLVETNTGIFASATDTGTDPTLADTDDDLAPDGYELLEGTNPVDPAIYPGVLFGDTYTQNFDGFANGTTDLGDGTTIGSNNGTAQVLNEGLRLTALGVGSTRGSFRIPPIEGSSQGWTATFDVTLNGGSPPADGFSLNYGAIQELTTTEAGSTGHGNAEAGMGGSEFFYQFDTYNNNDTTNTPGFGIRDTVANVELARANTILVPNNGTVTGRVGIIWTPTETTFITSGFATDITFFEVPHTFVGDDSFGWAFSSRTGGATEDLIIDNLVITVAEDGPELEITDIQYVVDPNDGLADVTITWASKPDATYIIYASSTAEAPFDADLQDGYGSQGSTTSYTETDIDITTNPVRFYKVEQE